jgi:hypothetical protein
MNSLFSTTHIFRSVAQRRHMDRHDIEAEKQILPELLRSTLCSKLRLVVAMTRTSTLIVRFPPTRSNSRSCNTRNSLACVPSERFR